MFICLNGSSSTFNSVKDIIKKEGRLYLQEDGNLFSIDTKAVIVKPFSSVKDLLPEYKIIKEEAFGYIVIEVPLEVGIQDYVKKLRETKRFELVDYITEVKCYWTPNDSLLSGQWFVNKLKLPLVWEITKGNPNIRVAVIDTGVDRDHFDIGYGYGNYTNISYNYGWDYVSDTQYHTPHSQGSHGTEIAGLISAKSNNIHGVAGMAGGDNSPGVTLMSYRVIEKDGDYTSSMGTAIKKAVDQGANIINISMGLGSNSSTMEALDYAYNHGVVVVCATGNDGNSNISFPASYNSTIAVGASSINDLRENYSNFGTGIDLVSPTYLSSTTSLNNNYFFMTATSMAAALVSGTAALMLSVNSSLTPDQIRTILQKTATKLPGYTYNSNGWNSEVGYGMLNTFAAVLAASNTQFLQASTMCNGTSASFSLNGLLSGMTVQWSFSDGYGSSAPTIQTSGNSCTITNNLSRTYRGKLNAQVYSSGNLIATLTKDLILYSGFYGQYTSDNLSGTISYSPVFYVKPGFSTVITSPNLLGATVSYDNSGTPPLYFQHDPTLGRLQLTMPTNNGGTPVIINVDDICGSNTVLYAMPQNSYYLNIAYEGSNIIISLDKEGVALRNSSADQSWSYEIRSATRGDIRASGRVNSSSTTISTTGWSKGIYIIKAIIGKEETTEKLIVK